MTSFISILKLYFTPSVYFDYLEVIFSFFLSGMNHSPRGPDDHPSRPLDMTSGGGPGDGGQGVDGHPYYGGGGMHDEGQGERWGSSSGSRPYGGADFIPPRDWRR